MHLRFPDPLIPGSRIVVTAPNSADQRTAELRWGVESGGRLVQTLG